MIAKRLGFALALAAGFLAVSAGLRYLAVAGVIEATTATRAIQVLIGLGLAAYANFLPKQLGRAAGSVEAQARAQTAVRVGGWSMALGGLAYAALWAFAPLEVADVVSIPVVAVATLTTLVFAFMAVVACRRAGSTVERRA